MDGMTINTKAIRERVAKAIPGYDGYFAREDGTIWNATRQLAAHANLRGYLSLTVKRGGRRVRTTVHKLVLLAWSGPRPDGMMARHLNGKKTDNRPANLVWGTHAENMADRVRLGESAFGLRNGVHTHPESVPRGERAHRSKLTMEKVRLIRLNPEKLSQRALAKQFGVSLRCINHVRRRNTWTHV